MCQALGIQRSLRHKALSVVVEPNKQPITIQCGNVHGSSRRTRQANVRKKEGIDLKVDLGACKKKMRHEEIQFFKVFD